MGFGAANVVYSQKFWELSEKIPLIIEIIDEKAKIEAFTETIKPYFDKVKNGGMITSEKANIILHKI